MTLAHTLEEEVARLYAAGLPVVPACRPKLHGRCTVGRHGVPCNSCGKRPLLSEYPGFARERLSLEATIAHFHSRSPCNVGIVTGGRFIVVEADSPEAEAEVIALAGGSPVTLTRECRPGRGRGWIFRHDGGPVPSSAHGGKSGAIDVRGDSGFFIVPPSRHATGHIFEWAPDLALGEVEISPVPPSLLALVTARAKAPLALAPRAKVTASLAPLPERVRFLISSSKRIRDLWFSRSKTRGDCTRSGYDYSIACELINRGVPPRDVAAAIAARPDAHSRDAEYCWRTVQAAIEASGHE